jgi:hypothetical protein
MTGSKHRGRPTTRAIVISLIAGLSMAATAGIAGGALKTKRAETSIEPGAIDSATAKCKQGTRAVSGGFDAPGFDAVAANDTYVQTFASLRSGKRKWTSTANNYPTVSNPGTLVDFVYCSDEIPKLKTKSATVTIPHGEYGSAIARCPRGGEAVSGGFDAEISTSFDGAFPHESRRVGKRKWIVTAKAFNNGSPAELSAYAYCAKRKLGLKSKSQSQTTSSASVNLSETARCPKGRKAISGGFGSSVGIEFGIPIEPFESQRAGGRVWRASTAAYSGNDPVRWEVYAYCLKKERK